MELFCATVILLVVGGAWFEGMGELAFHLCAFKMSYNMCQLIFFFFLRSSLSVLGTLTENRSKNVITKEKLRYETNYTW